LATILLSLFIVSVSFPVKTSPSGSLSKDLSSRVRRSLTKCRAAPLCGGDRPSELQRTRIAYLPGLLALIFLAISDFSRLTTTTRPDQSSLRLDDLQLGQMFPMLMKWQLLHAFSFASSTPPLFLLLLDLGFYPVKPAQEWLTHGQTDLPTDSTLWKTNSYYSGPYTVAFAKGAMCLLP